MDLQSERVARLLDNPRFHFVEGDITINKEWVEYQVRKCDVILPLVAIATPATYVREPLRVFELDFEANLPIIRHCVKYKKRVVFPSTSEVYGACRDKEFDPETSDLVLGARSTSSAGSIPASSSCSTGSSGPTASRGCSSRCSGPSTGSAPASTAWTIPKEGSSRVLTQFLGHIVRGEPIKLVDGGSQTRAFTFIDDARRLPDHASSTTPAASPTARSTTSAIRTICIRFGELAEMMLEIALARPEYAPTARNTRLDRHLGARLLRQGLCRYTGAAAVNQEYDGGARLDSEHRHAFGIDGDIRLLRACLAVGRRRCCRAMLNGAHIGLKVDVDTLRGTREGVPRLAALLKKHGIDATFYFSVGPDHTGRALRRVFRKGFAQKVARTSVLKHYGLKTLMYGVLLPGPDIGGKAGADMLPGARYRFRSGTARL